MENNKNNMDSQKSPSPSQSKNHNKNTDSQEKTNPTHHSPQPDESPTPSQDIERTPKKISHKKLILIVISLVLIAGIAGSAAFFATQQNTSEPVVENALENLLQQTHISEYEIAIEATNSDPLQSITYSGKDNIATNQHQGLITIATQQGYIYIDTFATPNTFYIRIPKTALDTLLTTTLTSVGGTGTDTTPFLQALLQPRIAPIADQWIRVDLETLNVDELILLMQTIFPEIRTTLSDLLGEETMPEEEWNRLEQEFTAAVETTIIPELTRFQQEWQQQNRIAEDIQLNILSIVKDTYSQYDIIRSAKEKETKTIDQRKITTYEIEIDQEQAILFTQSILKSIVETIESESIPFGITNEEIDTMVTQLTTPLSEEPVAEGEYTLTIGIDKEQQLPYLITLHIQPRNDSDETVTMTLKINAFNTNPVLVEPTDTETWVQVFKDFIILFLIVGLQGL